MKNIKSLYFYLSKDEIKMVIEAGEKTNKFIDIIYYLCCDIEDINLNEFINILLDYKDLNPGTDCACCYLINKICRIVKHICRKRLNSIYGVKIYRRDNKMEIEKSLNFYLSKKEVIMALKAGEEAGRYLTVVIYLCCDVTKINLDDFIKILTDYKTSHQEDAFMYDELIFHINEIVYKIHKAEINNIIKMIKEN